MTLTPSQIALDIVSVISDGLGAIPEGLGVLIELHIGHSPIGHDNTFQLAGLIVLLLLIQLLQTLRIRINGLLILTNLKMYIPLKLPKRLTLSFSSVGSMTAARWLFTLIFTLALGLARM